MTVVIDLKSAGLELAAKRGFRNWRTRFKENFGTETRCSDFSERTLTLLVKGKDGGAFYFFDLIMALLNHSSGFEFIDLDPSEKMGVMDRYLFLLDTMRYEFMKRLGWLEDYPGEGYTVVELILSFDQLAPRLQARTPELSKSHPSYEAYCRMSAFAKEEMIRKLIPRALRKIEDFSPTP